MTKTGLRKILIDAGYRSSPDFIIIGAQKAGTSSLFQTLAQHPRISTPLEKELHYFDDSSISYGKVSEYHAKFPLPHRLYPGKITFEASPSYLYHPEAAKRIYKFNPNIKLIAILREPVSRAFSAYNFYAGFNKFQDQSRRSLWEQRNFEDAIDDELSSLANTNFLTDRRSYLSRGLYARQLEQYFHFFPKEQILILDYSDYKEFFENTMLEICYFLRLKNHPFRSKSTNVTKYVQNEINPDTRNRLENFFKPYNEELFKLLERKFNW